MPNAKAVFLETLLVAALGMLLAVTANALSQRGINLRQDYFPGAAKPPVLMPSDTPSVAPPATRDSVNPSNPALKRLRQRGLQLVSRSEVVTLFRDLRYEQGLVVFVDARDDQHYTTGHIPGAWQFYHYRAENYLPAILPVCLTALQVVVYCAGGECEDSEFAAIMLRDAGVPAESLFVYAGGITDWTTHGLPVETGSRRSGVFLAPKP